MSRPRRRSLGTILCNIWEDIRFAGRLSAKNRRVTLVMVLTLGIGIGAANAVLAVINVLTRGLPIAEPHRILSLSVRDAAGRDLGISYREFIEWQASLKSLVALTAFADGAVNISERGESPERIGGAYVSAETFSLIDAPPLLGRAFRADDDRPGAPLVILLAPVIWKNRFGADPTILGRPVVVNGRPATVVGIMPDGFGFPYVAKLWQPLGAYPGVHDQAAGTRAFRAIGRLANGVSITQARAELERVHQQLAAEEPAPNRNTRASIERFPPPVVPPTALAALGGAVTAVLLIACANVANLLLTLSTRRSAELSIRRALGATPWRLAGQLLAEAACLTAAAGIVALACSVLGLRLFSVIALDLGLPYYVQWTVDSSVFTRLLGVSAVAAVIFWSIPALYAARTTTGEFVRHGRTTVGSRHAHQWTAAILISELTFTLVLLHGAGLMGRSFRALAQADLLVNASHLTGIPLLLAGPRYHTADQRLALHRTVERRFASIPEVASVSVVSVPPFFPAPIRQLSIRSRTYAGGDALPTSSVVAIGAEYFDTVGVTLLRGRKFTETDGTPGQTNAIINQRFASMYFPGENPLGQQIHLTAPSDPSAEAPWLTVVGISPTIRQNYARDLDPVVYVPNRGDSATSAILVRGLGTPTALNPILRQTLFAIDPDLPLRSTIPLTDGLNQSRWPYRVFGTVFGVFAAIGVFLSVIGLYAVTSYTVTQRTPEIGLRMAFGARPWQVVWLFARRSLPVVGCSLAAGAVGAMLAGRVIETLLFRTTPSDPITLLSTMALLSIVTALTVLSAAKRATSLDPAVALRDG